MPKPEFRRNILLADYEQTFEMLRHYDTFHWDITKFCFGQICVIIGACWYIYEHDLFKMASEEHIRNMIIAVLLIASSLFTFLCVISLLRNRLYFCKVSHYINEFRAYALNEDNGLSFGNTSNMWNDATYPKKVDWGSTQFLSIYLLTLCMVSAAAYSVLLLSPEGTAVARCIITALGSLILVIICGCYILHDASTGTH